MPSVTNARASIDYDWDGLPASNSGSRDNHGTRRERERRRGEREREEEEEEEGGYVRQLDGVVPRGNDQHHPLGLGPHVAVTHQRVVLHLLIGSPPIQLGQCVDGKPVRPEFGQPPQLGSLQVFL
jgi:hypothetical protein